MKSARDLIVDAVVEAVKAIPHFEGRVFRDGVAGWDERTFPTAIVETGTTRVAQLGRQEGYEIQRRISTLSIAIGVREYEDEDPSDELSDLLAAVEDAVVGLEGSSSATLSDVAAAVESVDTLELGGVDVGKDTGGRFLSTDISFAIEFYTQKFDAGSVLSGS